MIKRLQAALAAFTLPWWAAGIVANGAICAVEYFNRTQGATGWMGALRYTLPFIIIGQWALYRSWHGAPTMIVAWMFFTIGNNLVRLLSSYFLVGERFGWQVPLGCAVMFAGSYLVKMGMR